MKLAEPIFLRPNIIHGSYPDADSYLDTQFRLLREDFFHPLRSGLLGFKTRVRETKDKRPARIDNVRFYYSVEISDYETTERHQVLLKYSLKFSTKGLEREGKIVATLEGSNVTPCLHNGRIIGLLRSLSQHTFDITENQSHSFSHGRIHSGQINPSAITFLLAWSSKGEFYNEILLI